MCFFESTLFNYLTLLVPLEHTHQSQDKRTRLINLITLLHPNPPSFAFSFISTLQETHNHAFVMGIQGLLPLVKSIEKRVHLKDYAGMTLAVDGYVWLHKGAFACAQEICLGQPTQK